MANRIDIRRWERTDKAQPVYKASLSLWEAPLYVAIGAAAIASVCTPARASFSVVHQTQPGVAWITQGAVDPVLATYVPIYDAQQASVRTPDWPRLEDRHRTAPQSVYKAANTLFEAVLYPPSGDAQRASLRTPARPSFEVRHQTEPQPAWLFTSQPATVTQAQLWPAIAPDSFRASSASFRDSRFHTADSELGWLQPILDRTVAIWIPAFDSELATYRASGRPSFTVTHQTEPQPAWLFTNLPVPATPAQIVPALASGMASGFTRSRPVLNVREWVFQTFGVPEDATAPQQAGIWAQSSAPGLTPDRARLDVRRHRSDPPSAWITANLTGSSAPSVAQTMPAILQMSRMTDPRARLDVRVWWFQQFGTPEEDANAPSSTTFRRGLTRRTGARA